MGALLLAVSAAACDGSEAPGSPSPALAASPAPAIRAPAPTGTPGVQGVGGLTREQLERLLGWRFLRPPDAAFTESQIQTQITRYPEDGSTMLGAVYNPDEPYHVRIIQFSVPWYVPRPASVTSHAERVGEFDVTFYEREDGSYAARFKTGAATADGRPITASVTAGSLAVLREFIAALGFE